MARIDALEARVLTLECRKAMTKPDKAVAAKERGDSIKAIMMAVAQEFWISAGEMRGRSKCKRISHARQHVFLLAHEAGHSTPAIGRFFDRDHTTILHGITHARARRDAVAKPVNVG